MVLKESIFCLGMALPLSPMLLLSCFFPSLIFAQDFVRFYETLVPVFAPVTGPAVCLRRLRLRLRRETVSAQARPSRSREGQALRVQEVRLQV